MGSNFKKYRMAGIFLFVLLILPFPDLFAETHPRFSSASEKEVMSAAEAILPFVVHLEIQRGETLPSLSKSLYFPFLTPSHAFFEGTHSLAASRCGSGILIDPQGHILTNAFLVRGVHKVRCFLFKGKWINANMVGSDPTLDVAVLKIPDGKSLPHASIGSLDKISAGEWVIALGHYTAKKPTIATGIITTEFHQTTFEPENCQTFLQTDVQINLFNTGGPLITLEGKIVGMNDVILTRRCNLREIGFAVPWNIVRHAAQQIITSGTIAHGWIGLRIQDVILREHKGRKGFMKGVMVIEAIKGGPAYPAGIKPGDILLKFQDIPIHNSLQLKRLVSLTPVGKTVTLRINRRGREIAIPVKVGKKLLPSSSPDLKSRLGISLAPASKDPARGKEGVIISWIDPYGPMGRAGFEIHDIILEANGKSIKNESDLKQLLTHLNPGDSIIFHAMDHRTHRTGYVQVRLR